MKIRSAAILFMAFFLGISPVSVAQSEINQQIVPQATMQTVTLPVSSNPVVPVEISVADPLPQNNCDVFDSHAEGYVDPVARINLHDGGSCYGSLQVARAPISEQPLAIMQAPVFNTQTIVIVVPTWHKQMHVSQGSVPSAVAPVMITIARFGSSQTEQRAVNLVAEDNFAYNPTAPYDIVNVTTVMRC